MRAPLLGMAAVFVSLWCAYYAVSEPGPRVSPWVSPLPSHAVAAGYRAFVATAPGRAIPAWPEAVMERWPPKADGPILIDRRHTVKQPETSALGLNSYGYDDMHGLSRAFDPARRAGVPLVPFTGEITATRLAGASAVFINLPSGDRPGLRWSEVLALDAFVRAGGGLMFLTDHTNCYFHGELLSPLATRLGLTLRPVTAADRGPERTLSPSTVAWIRVVPAPQDHPVLHGVSAFGFMTGGSATGDPAQGWRVLATTSPKGWADVWTPHRRDDSSGFTGDLKRDATTEPNEEVPVMLAAERGRGRVLVFADQNALGATLIGFEDGAKLFANALSWLTGRSIPYEPRQPNTVTTLTGPRYLCTSVSDFAYRTLQLHLDRLSAASAVESFCTAWAPTDSASLLVLPESWREDLPARLAAARSVVIVLDSADAQAPQLAAAVGLTLTAPGSPIAGLRWLKPLPAPPLPVLADPPEFEPLSPAPWGLSAIEGWEVLAEDGAGRPVIVRRVEADRQTVVLLDAALVKNGLLGGERDRPHKLPPEGQAASRVALRLMSGLVGAWR